MPIVERAKLSFADLPLADAPSRHCRPQQDHDRRARRLPRPAPAHRQRPRLLEDHARVRADPGQASATLPESITSRPRRDLMPGTRPVTGRLLARRRCIKDNFDRGSSTDPDRTGSRASCPLPCAATLVVVLRELRDLLSSSRNPVVIGEGKRLFDGRACPRAG
jgi:hypothetical protein